jgi:isoleucyl-tRNA synthetase
VIYQNLVRRIDSAAPESIHHCYYPTADEKLVDENLIEQMSLVRQVCSLGLSARSAANLKVRQPLAKVLVHVGGGKQAELGSEFVDLILDELNVKAFDFVTEAGQLVEYRILPNNKLLGPKFGQQFPAVRQALADLAPATVVAQVNAAEPVRISIAGEPFDLAPAEILVTSQPAEGLAVAADRVVTVAIDTVISDTLLAEGLAREIVRRVQNMRKEADFNIEDRIILTYQADGRPIHIFEDWADYIKTETLATKIVHGLVPERAYMKMEKIDGETITLGIERVN